jgi:alpha-glucosidase
MVAEAWLPDWKGLAKYLRPDEYHQTFDFAFLLAPWAADTMREVIEESLGATADVGSVPTWVLSNHDVVRNATRYGLPKDIEARHWLLAGDRGLLDAESGLRRARASALLMLALPGSVYIYQGEELGLPEVHDLSEEVLDDPVWERSGHTEKGRDGCRVPIPWRSSGPSFGFGDDGPWLPQPASWGELSVERQDGLRWSTLELYREAMRIRSERLRQDEDLEWLDHGDGVLAFRRGSGLVCIVNYGPDAAPVPAGEVLLVSDPLRGGSLPPDTAMWLSTR